MKYTNSTDLNDGGESVKVVLRIRPMNNLESSRGDENCTKVANEQTTQISSKYYYYFLNHVSI